MSVCACGSDWRVLAADLRSGRFERVLHPISFEWSTRLIEFGQGTLTLAAKDYPIRAVWPMLTMIIFQRKNSQGGWVGEWAGYVDAVRVDRGTAQVGLKELAAYLERRTIKRTVRWGQVEQTVIARDLARLGLSRGVPLNPVAASSEILRDREYTWWDRKTIGSAIIDLAGVVRGVEWESIPRESDGVWIVDLIFRDRVGVDRDYTLRSDRELAEYSLEISSADQANWVDAIGSGQEESTLIESAEERRYYPQLDAAPRWSEVTRRSTLKEHAEGWAGMYWEPRATPTGVIRGLDNPDPDLLRLGDTHQVRLSYGMGSYVGTVRVVGIGWRVSAGEAVSRAIEWQPLASASTALLNQEFLDDCPDC